MNPFPPPMLRGARGATTVSENSEAAVAAALTPLLDALLAKNDIRGEEVISMFFTLTPDLTKISPAKVARLHLDWPHVPMMCAQEPFVEGLPSRCIRVLIQFYTPKTQYEICPVYLNGAVALRPDLNPSQA